MKVWFDILTPKQLIYFDVFSKYLRKQGVECILTSRTYSEVNTLADLHNIKLNYCGTYGKTKTEKLKNSIKRMKRLEELISYEKPDVAINCCSPDACRIAYGLGIPLFLLNDTPWAEITNRLTMPLATRVWAPMVYKKSLFTKYGLKPEVIKHYDSIDAHITAQRKSVGKPPIKGKYVLVRSPEIFASYTTIFNNKINIITILREVKKEIDYKILVLCRHKEQYMMFKDMNDSQIIPTLMKYDGKMLYENAEFFIGSGGTMTAESAFSGTPTIMYNILITDKKNSIADYLVKENILLRITDISQLRKKIRYALEYKSAFKERAKDANKKMITPFSIFYDDIRQTLNIE